MNFWSVTKNWDKPKIFWDNNGRIGKDLKSGYGHWTKRKQNATMFMNSLVMDLKYPKKSMV